MNLRHVLNLRQILPVAGVLALLPTLPALAQSARPPAQIKITNARSVPLDSLEITTTGEQARLVAKLTKPLAPGKSVSLKLNKPSGCSYYLLGKFSDDVESDNDGVDLCKERSLRLTD
ncbi:MAG: hypothetical protein J0J10_25175 [Bosea sp.]|uniref:hypothetical protein n=1 Tax=Bosea sp. (in: a-proteobacteria) TaxID=1871050 RepID=UPI001AC96E44|nr:hypothetical protein [Bosea sp. (in: a-proteobacteria)]MBN9472062.1 hypothetical protein [Bosea sp. (in: a-proteobacteria)]